MNEGQIVYKRTLQGNNELMARHSDLGPVLNSLLVLVNGRATRDDLMTVVTRLGAPANSINMLEAGGYIGPADAAGTRATLTAHDAPGSTAPLTDTERRARLYEHLIGAVKQHLGLTGFMYHLKVEKAVTLSDLNELIGPVGKAIAKARGAEAADAFLKIVKPLAPG